jgi:hypothetical protein
MEIVSKPDIRGPEEAAEYVRKLRQILRYLGTCDGNMQEGSLRADVNVSVRPKGSTELGTRCEIKNMNSMRFIQQAIEFEARRQIAILEDGGRIDQETRLYDPNKGETRSMRSKEEAHDYRYFPCPDLLPLEFEQAWVDGIAAGLPELPDAKKARFVLDYGMTEYDAGVLTAEVSNADYFESVARGRDGKQAANWVINELFGRLNKEGHGIEHSPISPDQLGGLIDLIARGDISGKIAKDLFEILWTEGGDPAAVVEARGMRQVTDLGAIEAAVDQVIAANPGQGRPSPGQAGPRGMVRGAGDEVDGGQGEPPGSKRARAQKDRHRIDRTGVRTGGENDPLRLQGDPGPAPAEEGQGNQGHPRALRPHPDRHHQRNGPRRLGIHPRRTTLRRRTPRLVPAQHGSGSSRYDFSPRTPRSPGPAPHRGRAGTGPGASPARSRSTRTSSARTRTILRRPVGDNRVDTPHLRTYRAEDRRDARRAPPPCPPPRTCRQSLNPVRRGR